VYGSGTFPTLTKNQKRLARHFGEAVTVERKFDPWREMLPPQAQNWPVHAPLVEVLILSHILYFASQLMKPAIRVVERILSDTSMYRQPQWQSIPKSKIPTRHVHTLLRNGLMEPLRGTARGWGWLFLVAEAAKQRWRVITDTLTNNVYAEEAPRVFFRSIAEVCAFVYVGTWAALVDLKAAFYQLQYAEAVREYFAVRVGTETYTFIRGAMGFRNMVYCLQAIMIVLLGEGCRHRTDAYIDGGIIVTEAKAECEEALKEVMGRCAYARATVGSVEGPVQIATYRGIEMNLVTKEVRMAQVFHDKFEARWLTMANTGASSFARVESVIGMCVYATQVLKIPLGMMFHVFKWQAACLRTKVKPKSYVHLPHGAWKELQFIAFRILTNAPVHPEQRPTGEAPILIVDASPIAYGGVLVFPSTGIVYTTSGSFTDVDAQRPIAELEAMAVTMSLDDFAAHVYDTGHIRIFTDNENVRFCLQGLRSRNFFINRHILQIWTKLGQLRLTFNVARVSSKMNPADGLSRHRAFNSEDWMKVEDITRKEDAGQAVRRQLVDLIDHSDHLIARET
jgi:hypothetical protein